MGLFGLVLALFLLPISTTYFAKEKFGGGVAALVFVGWVVVTIILIVLCNDGIDLACMFAQWLEFVFYVCLQAMANKSN
jgi:hypothetical protein